MIRIKNTNSNVFDDFNDTDVFSMTKFVRGQSRAGLKECKQYVEHYMRELLTRPVGHVFDAELQCSSSGSLVFEWKRLSFETTTSKYESVSDTLMASKTPLADDWKAFCEQMHDAADAITKAVRLNDAMRQLQTTGFEDNPAIRLIEGEIEYLSNHARLRRNYAVAVFTKAVWSLYGDTEASIEWLDDNSCSVITSDGTITYVVSDLSDANYDLAESEQE